MHFETMVVLISAQVLIMTTQMKIQVQSSVQIVIWLHEDFVRFVLSRILIKTDCYYYASVTMNNEKRKLGKGVPKIIEFIFSVYGSLFICARSIERTNNDHYNDQQTITRCYGQPKSITHYEFQVFKKKALTIDVHNALK